MARLRGHAPAHSDRAQRLGLHGTNRCRDSGERHSDETPPPGWVLHLGAPDLTQKAQPVLAEHLADALLRPAAPFHGLRDLGEV